MDAIKHVKTLEALLDLAPEAPGAAESVWHERARRLGMGAAPLIAQRLRATPTIADPNERDSVQERMARLPQKREAENEDAVMALIAIAQRIGREAMLTEMAAFEQLTPPARRYSYSAPGNTFSPAWMGTLSRFSRGVNGQL